MINMKGIQVDLFSKYHDVLVYRRVRLTITRHVTYYSKHMHIIWGKCSSFIAYAWLVQTSLVPRPSLPPVFYAWSMQKRREKARVLTTWSTGQVSLICTVMMLQTSPILHSIPTRQVSMESTIKSTKHVQAIRHRGCWTTCEICICSDKI